MSLSFTNSLTAARPVRGLLPLCAGTAAYLLVTFLGDALLHDSDTFWQIKVGQWIIDHHAVPSSDLYSFTRLGEPWISGAWLSQVLYALVYSKLGWAGPVVLSSLAVGITFAIFVWLCEAYFEPAHSILVAILALILSCPHFLARPHMLALPLMVAWVGAMISAADRRGAPSLLLLPLMALWANLHGGFVLGLAVIAPIALIAVWDAAPERRIALIGRWAVFAVAALAASCCTAYGWDTLFAAAKILDLGQVLSTISEWRPADFGSFGLFEACILGLMGLALYRGIVLSLPRILLLLLLAHMALAHVRSIDAFALLFPLVLAKPLAGEEKPAGFARDRMRWPPSLISLFAFGAIAVGGWASTLSYVAHHQFAFASTQAPAAAVDILKKRQAKRIFNAYEFGGYLIARDVPTFIDGRAELYGEKFIMDYYTATGGPSVDGLLPLLDEYRIDATLLTPASPAAKLLDHVRGWQRLYADSTAVIHVRTEGAK